MPSEQVKLLGSWSSPFVNRVMISFNLKSVDYEMIEEDVLAKSDLLLKSNPVYKKIPVLIHGGRPLCESLVIVEYIDEVWASGPSILPSNPYNRATARFWSNYIDDKLFSGFKTILTANGDEAKAAGAIEEITQALIMLEDVFTKANKGHKFFGGDDIGYLDIALGSFLSWIKVVEKMGNFSLLVEWRTPNLSKWAQDFSADDAVKDVMPETDKLLNYALDFMAKFKAINRSS